MCEVCNGSLASRTTFALTACWASGLNVLLCVCMCERERGVSETECVGVCVPVLLMILSVCRGHNLRQRPCAEQSSLNITQRYGITGLTDFTESSMCTHAN